MISITNIGKRLLTIHMDHPKADKLLHCHYQKQHDPRSGKSGKKLREIAVCNSFLLPVGSTKSGLPDWVAEISFVRDSKDLKVTRIASKEERLRKSRERAERLKKTPVFPTVEEAE